MSKPIIIQLGKNENDIENLKLQATEVVDIYQLQLKELFKIENPADSRDEKKLAEFLNAQDKSDQAGVWVQFPWNGKLLHCISADKLFELRTNRNKNLVSSMEQKILASKVVGIAGMSVGAGIATALAYSGISKTMKIADFDELDTSNLNRLRENLLSVGKKKVELASQHLYELDPFLDIHEYSEGIDETNISDFFDDPSLDYVIDEIDDFRMKVLLRIEAKKRRIPVIMFTSLGDNILVDIERFDTDEDLLPFHGLIGDIAEEILSKENISPEDIKRYSIQVVGAEYIPTKALASVMEMGRSLVGRPQLYSTIAIDGGLAAYVVRQLSLSNKPESGRYFMKFGDLFKLDEIEFEQTAERKDVLQKLKG